MRYGNSGSYQISDLPGYSQIGVTHSVFITPEHRGKGWGQIQHKHRLAELKRLGYDVALCTVEESNAVEIHILYKHGWERLFAFKSSRTEHEVALWMKRL